VKRWFFLPVAFAVGILWLSRASSVATVSGVVWDAAGRGIPNAVVRVKSRAIQTTTDSEGRFSLIGLTPAFRVHLTAWQKDFYIGGTDVWPWSARVQIRLARFSARDHGDYRWVPPSVQRRSAVTDRLIRITLELAGRFAPETGVSAADGAFTLGCRDCHDAVYQQWAGSAHARGSANPRFLTLYNGTDVHGARSPSTRYFNDPEYGRVPLRPDPAAHDYGPGFKLDFPESAGTCATCHLPSAALDRPFDSDPNRITGVPAQAVHCDFCHKAEGVALDTRTKLPADNMPGVLSMRIVRPAPGLQLFFGPFDDVDGRRDTRAPVMEQSELCAPCHQGAFWGVPIYESFGEWKASPFPGEGKTCQSCHMTPDGTTTNIAPYRGGITRRADTVATHDFPGASSPPLLQSAASLTIVPGRSGDRVRVEVTVTNTGTGHRLPTDSPLREVFLVVTANDSHGATVPLSDGPTLPEWAGDLAGQPGLYFAKLLEQRWTSVVPSVAFWTHTRIVEDTRLAPRASITRTFEFKPRATSDVMVAGRLILRRAPYTLMRQKGWHVPDIEMNRAVITVGTS
jgi:hypothetical protein